MELVAKYLSGNANEEEKRQVEEWRNENPEEFLSYQETWSATGFQSFDVAAARAAVFSRIETQKKFSNPKSGAFSLKWLGIAAAVALLLGVSYIFFFNSDSDRSGVVAPDGWVMVETRAGETKNVKLPDGSNVTLNEVSAISYAPNFANNRNVNFAGTAFFEIVPDKDHPFKVETTEAVVTVLGTSFQVRAENQVQYSEVIVETGLVTLAKKPQPNVAEKSVKIELNAGEVGVVKRAGGGVAKSKNRDVNYLAWKTHKMTFNKTSMKDVASTLNKVYKVEVALGNEEIGNCKLTATFDKKPVEEVIEVISQTFGFEVAATADKYTLNGKACR